MPENGAENLEMEDRASMMMIATVGPARHGQIVSETRVEELILANRRVAVRDSSELQFSVENASKSVTTTAT